jgi:hypothetical protein
MSAPNCISFSCISSMLVLRSYQPNPSFKPDCFAAA